jgi:predicted nucleic acid-binding protein
MNSDNYNLDACHIVNVVNVGAEFYYGVVENTTFNVCPAVVGELEASGKSFSELLGDSALVCTRSLVKPENLSALVNDEKIGLGEANAILECIVSGAALVCDDRRARAVATKKLGAERVTGTLGFLRCLWILGHITVCEAKELNVAIKEAGGWIPLADDSYWK